MPNLALKAAENLQEIRANKPLIHNITNFVVMNYTANVLLATGASPVMAHAENEVEDMVAFAGALVLNIGTLSDSWISAMLRAGQKAANLQKPIILDPVGAGATPYRTTAARTIIDKMRVSIIRGNPSEVLSLGNEKTTTKGVDSTSSVEDAALTASLLARELDTILAITGPVDLVTDGSRVVHIGNGHALMPHVTGTGCSATAVIGAFTAVDPDYLTAAATALAFFGLAGEMAGKTATGPGSFMVHLLDALYTMTPDQLERGCRINAG